MAEPVHQHNGDPQIGIVVRDLEATTPFYRDGLGLPYLEDFDGPSGYMRRFRLGSGAILKLMVLPEPPTETNQPEGMFGGITGLRWLTIGVDDIEQVIERCEALGGRVPRPLVEWSPGHFCAVVEDPEGSCWVEIFPREQHLVDQANRAGNAS
jgi:predicted enzyme related to lactoylglutathione lyase